MCVGVWKESLIARVGPEQNEEASKEPFAGEFDNYGTSDDRLRAGGSGRRRGRGPTAGVDREGSEVYPHAACEVIK